MSDLELHLVPKELYYHEIAYVRGLETQIAELKKELDIWILGHAKLQSEHQAQIAAKDIRLAAWEEYAGTYFMVDYARAYMHLVRLVKRGETAARETE